MANIIRLGGGTGGGGSETSVLEIHEGKINTSGVIETNNNYYYTDAMPCPKGKICFDFGDTYSSNAMIAFYDTDDSFIDYWGSTARYRVLDFTNDYQAGRKMKLSFPKSVLTNTEYIDFEAFAIYSGSKLTDAVKIGGASEFDKVIDWALYSHPSDFDSIPLPANYTDYDHLAFIGVQATADQSYIEEMAMQSVKHYLNTGGSLDKQIYVINTSDISASDYSFHFPLMDANTYAFAIWTDAVINSSRLLGTNYSWAWQNLYVLVIGFND